MKKCLLSVLFFLIAVLVFASESSGEVDGASQGALPSKAAAASEKSVSGAAEASERNAHEDSGKDDEGSSESPGAASQRKVKVTRHGPSVLTFDVGGMLYIPLNDDSAKGVGGMVGGTITPIGINRFSLGFRAEGYVYAGTSIIHSENKKHELKIGFTGSFIAKCPIAKSFEIYGGIGAGFIFEDFDSLTDFGQTWGIVLQGGGRGRLNNHIGVGAQVNLMFDIPNETRHLCLLGYFTVEL